MRAILIDPWTRRVEETKHTGDYRHIYELLSRPGCEVSVFCVGGVLRNADTIYVDDEGLLKRNLPVFSVNGDNTVHLAGRALVLGTDAEGESVSVKSTLDAIKRMVGWTSYVTTGG